MLHILTIDSVRSAAARIRPFVLRTPVLNWKRPGLELFLKAESLQPIGAFKIRGAFSLMTTLPLGCPGVVTHSSGNHAQAVARAAKVLGMKAVIVMPSAAPELKRRRTEADGAEVILTSSDSDERTKLADKIAEERGLVLVPPYDHPLVAAGQGTAALELLEDASPLHRLYVPVSGGGLIAGCATAVRALAPATEVVGVEPVNANDTFMSMARGERVRIAPPETIADGLMVRSPGALTWPVIREKVSGIALVTEREMLDAMRFALLELRIVLEPSGAAGLAAALREGTGRVGVILSGGNAAPEILAQALETRA